MKKVIIITALLLMSLSSLLFAGMTVSGRPCPGGAASCTTSSDSAIYDWTGHADVGTPVITGESLANIAADRFTLGGSGYTITEYVVYVKDNNQAGSLYVKIYADNVGTPGTIGDVVADTTASIGHADVSDSTTYANATLTLPTPKALDAGTYWVVLSTVEAAGGSFTARTQSQAGMKVRANNAYYDDYSLKIAVYGCAR